MAEATAAEKRMGDSFRRVSLAQDESVFSSGS